MHRLPIELTVYYPKTEEGIRELSSRAACVHADTVSTYIQGLNCPLEQKLKLHDSLIQQHK